MLIQNIEHIFCSCYKVRSAWQWAQSKILDIGPLLVVSNTDIVIAMFPSSRQETECGDGHQKHHGYSQYSV